MERSQRIHGNSSKQSSGPRVRLSCQMCHRRKVKCDKKSPCTNCSRYGFVCEVVERARLPRGRSQKSSQNGMLGEIAPLNDRVAYLENTIRELVNKDEAGSAASTGILPRNEHNPASSNPSSVDFGNGDSLRISTAINPDHLSRSKLKDSANKDGTESECDYIGHSFWQDLKKQTYQKLSTRESPPTLGEDHLVLREKTSHTDCQRHTALLGKSLVSREISEGSLRLRKELFRVYLLQVDPIFKILHSPSLTKHILEDQPYLDFPFGHPAPAALNCAISYAASCSLSRKQCLELFGMERDSLIATCQRDADDALQRADFLVTNELTVLQALVIFLVSTRTHDRSRRAWTLLSMALRIAQAISLHKADPAFPIKPFELEMRRRLWHMIGILDIQACLDRASEPMMQGNWIRTNSPSNINDQDLSIDADTLTPSPEGTFTDMTFTLMLSHAQCTVRSLNFSDWAEPSVRDFQRRQETVMSFHQEASRLLRGCHVDASPLQWFTKEVAEFIHASLQLIAIRPLQRSPTFTPPFIPNDGLLRLAVNILERCHRLYQDPRCRAFRWFGNLFVPWHPLAVAIAESCVCNDQMLVLNVWPLIERAYGSFKNLMADSSDGMLWRPMTRFMERAKDHKDKLLFNVPTTMLSTQSNQTFSNRPDPSSGTAVAIGWPSQTPALGTVTVTGSAGTETGSTTTQAVSFASDDSYSGMWCPGEWGGVHLDGMDAAWENYESFMENVYDAIDADFMMR